MLYAPHERRTAALCAEIAILCLYAGLSWSEAWVAEDAYISFRYAFRLASGRGLTFNPDEAVEGFSNPLWVLLAAGFEALGILPDRVMPLLSAACGALLLMSIRRTGDGLGASTWASLGAMLVAAVCAPFVHWSTSGLETMPTALAFWLMARGAALDDRPAAETAVAAASLGLLRTEGIAWVVVLFGMGAGLRLVEGRRLDNLTRPFAVATATWLLWFGWKWSYYGDWVSNVARAKVSPGPEVWLRGLRYAAAWHLVQLWPLLVPAAVLVAPRRTRGVWLGLLALAAPAWAAVVGGDYMAYFRFVVPSIAPAALCLAWLFDRAGRGGAVLVAVCAALSAAPLYDRIVTPDGLLRQVAVRGRGEGRMTYVRGQFRDPIGTQPKRSLFLESQAISLLSAPGDRVVTAAIGYNGYFNPSLSLLDLCGLVSEEVAEREVEVSAADRPGHEKCTGPKTYLDEQPSLFGVHLSYGDPEVAAKDFRERTRKWRKADLTEAYAPVLVALDAKVRGRVVWAMGLHRFGPETRESRWAAFDAAMADLEAGREPDIPCMRALETPTLRSHRRAFDSPSYREALRKDPPRCWRG